MIRYDEIKDPFYHLEMLYFNLCPMDYLLYFKICPMKCTYSYLKIEISSKKNLWNRNGEFLKTMFFNVFINLTLNN